MSKFCFNCGAELDDDTAYCENCGSIYENKIIASEENNIQAVTTDYQSSAGKNKLNMRKARKLFIAIGSALLATIIIILVVTNIFSSRSPENTIDQYFKYSKIEPDAGRLLKLIPRKYIDYYLEENGMYYDDLSSIGDNIMDSTIEKYVDSYDDWEYTYEITDIEDKSDAFIKAKNSKYEKKYGYSISDMKIYSIRTIFTYSKDGQENQSSYVDSFTLVKIGNDWFYQVENAMDIFY